MKTNIVTGPPKPEFIISVHLTAGSTESFAIPDETEARRIWDRIEPSRRFSEGRLVLAGENSKSVYVCSQILRLDFIQETYKCRNSVRVVPMSLSCRKAISGNTRIWTSRHGWRSGSIPPQSATSWCRSSSCT